jgi:hypothetical protein
MTTPANMKQQVMWVFGLTGGELADQPWEVERGDDPEDTEVFDYWYKGAPDYAEGDFESEATLRTVCYNNLFMTLPKTIADRKTGEEWALVRDYGSGGETACPGQDEGKVEKRHCTEETDECVLCEEKVGEPHGMIYLGEGWVEAVYQKMEKEEDNGGE